MISLNGAETLVISAMIFQSSSLGMKCIAPFSICDKRAGGAGQGAYSTAWTILYDK